MKEKIENGLINKLFKWKYKLGHNRILLKIFFKSSYDLYIFENLCQICKTKEGYFTMKKIAIILFVSLFCTCKTEKLSDIDPYHRTAFYNHENNFSQKIEDRIIPASADVIDYLELLDSRDNYYPYILTTEEKMLFSEYFQMLPRKYRNIITEKVISIYFIDNFMTAGMANWVYDEDSNLYMVLFFNSEVLHQTVTDWVNYRDNSFFHDDNSEVAIASKFNNDYYALIAVLLHETSHIYDYYNRVTPYTEPVFKDGSYIKTPFVDGIWEDYNTPLSVYNFNHRNDLKAYGFGPTLDRTLAIGIYSDLMNTPFSSIYGSSNWAEDFAETFTWFYMEDAFETYYTVEISRNNEVLLMFSPSQNIHFQSRMRYLKTILNEQ
jgi:hypothetical protein